MPGIQIYICVEISFGLCIVETAWNLTSNEKYTGLLFEILVKLYSQFYT